MAVTFIKRSSIPVAVKGKAATAPTVSISDKGQITLNSLASRFLIDGIAGLGFDGGKVYLFRKDAKSVAKLPSEEFIVFRKAKKGDALSLSGSHLLKNSFPNHVYDYAGSGNQVLPVVIDEKNGALVFELPNGALPKRTVVARKPRAKKAASVRAEAGSTTVVAPTVELEPELVLEPA